MQSLRALDRSGRRNADVPSLRHPRPFDGREATEMTGNRRAWRNGWWASSILLAAIVFLAVGVTPGQGQSPVRGGTLRIGWIPNAKTLDPHLSSQFSDRYILYMAFNTLVALDRSFNVMPELARSWQVSPDGKQITFELQRGVKFHDGTDFNAEAVKWNIERILDPATNSTSRTLIEPAIAAGESILRRAAIGLPAHAGGRRWPSWHRWR